MNIIVHPQRGSYRLFFHDGRRVVATGTVELAKTAKGYRPKDYRLCRTGKRQARRTPTRELTGQLREAEVWLTAQDPAFESFLSDLQIPVAYAQLCRMCLVEERITPLTKKNRIKSGKEAICRDCASKEMRRELGYLGGVGRQSLGHLERLLDLYRDLDRVLGMVQPERPNPRQTLFDVVEAHPVQKTVHINELPLTSWWWRRRRAGRPSWARWPD